MKSSKSPFLGALLVVTTALIALGCDGRREHASDATFEVDEVTLEKTAVAERDQYKLPSVKVFLFKTCLRDKAARSPIQQTDFLVSDGVKTQSVRTNVDGCVFWSESHRISSLQPERRLHIKRSFEGRSVFRGNVEVHLSFNPWHDEGELYDLRWFNPPDLGHEAEDLAFESDLSELKGGGFGSLSGSVSARAFVSDVALLFEGHDKEKTQISTLLTLKPAQKFQMRFEPKFLRKTMQEQELQMDMNGGHLKIRLVIVRDGKQFNPTAQDLVAEYEGEAQVSKNGVVDSNILLRIHDVAATLSRNQAILILSPVETDNAWTTLPGVYTGSVSALKGEDVELSLREVKENALFVADAVDDLLKQAKSSPKAIDVLARDPHLKLRYDIDREKDLRQWMKGPRGVAATRELKRSYCDRLYAADQVVVTRTENSWWLSWLKPTSTRRERALGACRLNPDRFVRLAAESFVESVKGNRHMGGSSSPKTIAISRSLTYSKTQTDENGSELSLKGGVSLEVGLDADLGYGASAGAKIGIGKEWFYTSSFKRSNESAVETKVSEEQALSVIHDTYEVDVVVRDCALVTGVVPGTGFYACESETTVKTARETYYLVNHLVESSPLTDELASNQWRLVVRGDGMYRNFEKMMTMDNTVLGFSKVFSSPSMEAKLLPDFKATQTYPGVISSDR
ncbi:MAG: hypothetical protein KF802_09035 [Bdellovibrionaceae bacterium]|nr:hypothetical protein [Pseudobdellovibrionaceae bacterium]